MAPLSVETLGLSRATKFANPDLSLLNHPPRLHDSAPSPHWFKAQLAVYPLEGQCTECHRRKPA